MTAQPPNTRPRNRRRQTWGLVATLGLILAIAPVAPASELEGTWRLQGSDDAETVDAEKRLPIFIRHRDRSVDVADVEAWDATAKGTPANKTATTFELKKGFIQTADGKHQMSYRRVGERIMMPSMGGGTRDKHFFYYADAWPGSPASKHDSSQATIKNIKGVAPEPEPVPKRDHDTKMAVIRNLGAHETENATYRFDCHLPKSPRAGATGLAHVRVLDGRRIADTQMPYRIDGHHVLLLDETGRVKVRFPWDRPGAPSGDPDLIGQPPQPRTYLQANQSDLAFLRERARDATDDAEKPDEPVTAPAIPATPTVRPRPQRPTPKPRMHR